MAWEKWKFNGNFVSAQRRKYLDEEVDFDKIIRRIYDEMSSIEFKVERGISRELKNCRRPIFKFDVCTETFDLFFNSPWGYRGQYCIDIETGLDKNKSLLEKISEKLIGYGRKNSSKSLSAEQIERSLRCISAKIWICEKQINLNDVKLREEILNSTWLQNAHYARAELDRGNVRAEKINAITGIRAPEGKTLDVKGAWITPCGDERVDIYKTNRSEHIRDCGFS